MSEPDIQRTCFICGKSFPPGDTSPLALVRPQVLREISTDFPDPDPEQFICKKDLSTYRARYVQSLLVREKGELGSLEENVIESMRQQDIMSTGAPIDFEGKLSFGQRLADKIATFGGSWTFLISFFLFLLVWIGINSVILLTKPFDPFPFILLNLILSCIAAIQAPVIMMSQNRQEAKDRIRAEHDYQINLKAELEIRHLHEKMDHLLMQQWERLVEIQQLQIELIEELGKRKDERDE